MHSSVFFVFALSRSVVCVSTSLIEPMFISHFFQHVLFRTVSGGFPTVTRKFPLLVLIDLARLKTKANSVSETLFEISDFSKRT